MTRKIVIGLGDSILLQASSGLFRCFDRHHVTYLDTEKGLDLDSLDRNVGPSTKLPTYIDAIFKKGLYADVLILACGLHDIKHVSGNERPMVSLREYSDNLERVFERARRVARETIWVLMPPIFDEHHNARLEHKRFDSERMAYSGIAVEIAYRHGVTVIAAEDVLGSFDPNGLVDHVHPDQAHTERYAKGICTKIIEHILGDRMI